MPLGPIYCLPPYSSTFAHTVHRLFYFSFVLFTVRLFMCNSVLLFLSHCFALSWPGHSCKQELVLNWPTWLNQGEINKSKICRDSCSMFPFFHKASLINLQCRYYPIQMKALTSTVEGQLMSHIQIFVICSSLVIYNT